MADGQLKTLQVNEFSNEPISQSLMLAPFQGSQTRVSRTSKMLFSTKAHVLSSQKTWTPPQKTVTASLDDPLAAKNCNALKYKGLCAVVTKSLTPPPKTHFRTCFAWGARRRWPRPCGSRCSWGKPGIRSGPDFLRPPSIAIRPTSEDTGSELQDRAYPDLKQKKNKSLLLRFHDNGS